MKAALLLLLPGLVGLPLAAGVAQQSGFMQQSASSNYSLLMTSGADAMVDGKYALAATDFQKAAALDPQNAQAQFWAGQALVYADLPEQAIYFLERAQTLGSDSVALHLALVAAYAGALRPTDRNRETALLHAWHADGTHASLAHANGFLVETIFTRPWHINVEEFFGEQGAPDVLWRFTVRDPAEIIEATYVLREAEGGGQEFLLLHYDGDVGQVSEATGVATPGGQSVKRYASRPAYDLARADVLQRVRSLPAMAKK